MFIVHWPHPLKSRIHFPTSSKHLKNVFITIHNSSLYSLQTWWTLLLCACANRRRAEWAPLSVVCDESYSAWLWPEAAVGCVINQELWMANERLHTKTRNRADLVVWNNLWKFSLFSFGGGRSPPPTFQLRKFAVTSHVRVWMQSETWTISLFRTKGTSRWHTYSWSHHSNLTEYNKKVLLHSRVCLQLRFLFYVRQLKCVRNGLITCWLSNKINSSNKYPTKWRLQYRQRKD